MASEGPREFFPADRVPIPIPTDRMASVIYRSGHPVTRVSVIVPTWNEESGLAGCLRSVGTPYEGLEVIVVDGGSLDGTLGIAHTSRVRVVHSSVRQRAHQLNVGARMANGEILMFLHADTLLPRGWLAQLRSAFRAHPKAVGGAYCRRFDQASHWLSITCALADWRGRTWGVFLGDQAMFVRSDCFAHLGGFRAIDRCEDLEFSLRMKRAGSTLLLRGPVISSARRFRARGPFRQTLTDLSTAWRFIRHWSPPEGREAPVCSERQREAAPTDVAFAARDTRL